jgi:hypothetical protein
MFWYYEETAYVQLVEGALAYQGHLGDLAA